MPAENTNKKDPNGGKKRRPRQQESGDRIAEAISALKDTIANKADASTAQEGREDKGNKILSVATLIFVIFTTCGIFVQACVMRSSDETFKETLRTQKEISAKQLRAYISVGVENISSINDAGPVRATIYIKNIGLTPAYKIIYWLGIGRATWPTPKQGIYDLAPPPQSFDLNTGILGAGERVLHPIEMPDPIDYRDRFWIFRGYEAIYLFGEVGFTDVYQIRHRCTFRFEISLHSLKYSLPAEQSAKGNDCDYDGDDTPLKMK